MRRHCLGPRTATSGKMPVPGGSPRAAEWSGDYPKFNPMLQKAGVRWLRLFPEWQTIQPKQDQWNWKPSDAMVADARANNIHLLGLWAYFAPWASADGGTRKCPIKDMQYWRDYVGGTVRRYQEGHQVLGSLERVQRQLRRSNEQGEGLRRSGGGGVRHGQEDRSQRQDRHERRQFRRGLPGCGDQGRRRRSLRLSSASILTRTWARWPRAGKSGYLSLAGNLRKMLAANKQRGRHPALDHRDRLPDAHQARCQGRRPAGRHAGQGLPPFAGAGL